jgi:hypothetical protein
MMRFLKKKIISIKIICKTAILTVIATPLRYMNKIKILHVHLIIFTLSRPHFT